MPVLLVLFERTVALPETEAPAGWFPENASEPPPRRGPARVDLEIHDLADTGAGYLLVATSSEPTFNGDTWHPTLEEALEHARRSYGAPASEWQQPA